MAELGLPPVDGTTIVALSIVGAAVIVSVAFLGGVVLLLFTYSQPDVVNTSYTRDLNGNIINQQTTIT